MPISFNPKELFAVFFGMLSASTLSLAGASPDIARIIGEITAGTVKSFEYKAKDKTAPELLATELKVAVNKAFSSLNFEIPHEAKDALIRAFSLERTILNSHLHGETGFLENKIRDTLSYFAGECDIDSLPWETIITDVTNSIEQAKQA